MYTINIETTKKNSSGCNQKRTDQYVSNLIRRDHGRPFCVHPIANTVYPGVFAGSRPSRVAVRQGMSACLPACLPARPSVRQSVRCRRYHACQAAGSTLLPAVPCLPGGGINPVAGGATPARRRDHPCGRRYHACQAAGSPLSPAVPRLPGGGITPVAGGTTPARRREHPCCRRYHACQSAGSDL